MAETIWVAGYLWCACCVWLAVRSTHNNAQWWIGRPVPAVARSPMLVIAVACFWWAVPILCFVSRQPPTDLELLARRAYRHRVSEQIADSQMEPNRSPN